MTVYMYTGVPRLHAEELTLSWLSITPFGLPVVPDCVCVGGGGGGGGGGREGGRKDRMSTAPRHVLQQCCHSQCR